MTRWPLAAVLAVAIASPAAATTLDDAIALAMAHEPGLKRAQAEVDAARARVSEARAGRLPSLTASGEIGAGRMDYGSFFGFGARDIIPSAARLTLQQPVFEGGSINASVDQAKEGKAAADQTVRQARLTLEARVAEVYGGVLVAEEAVRLNGRRVEAAGALAHQASLTFESGESPRTDLAQAQARAAQAKAGLAQAQGDLARARAAFRALTGEEPAELAPFEAPPALPASLDEALSAAHRSNPGLAAAQAQARAADAGERRARGGLLPHVGLVAELSSQRDQFLPGYRADGYTVGVQARWVLYSGGLQSAKVAEARADRRAADAAVAQVFNALDETVVAQWNAVVAADRMAEASAAEASAADAAETSLGYEVKAGAKPMVDLLNAQRDTLAARTALARAKADQIVARYRLRAALGL